MAIVCFLLAIVVLVMCCMYSYEMKFQGIFLEYATRFLNANGCVFFYIPVYLLLTLGLVALIVWQHCAFSSKYATSKNFYNFNNVGVFEILNIL